MWWRGFVLWMPCRFFVRDLAAWRLGGLPACRLGARLFFSRKGAETQRAHLGFLKKSGRQEGMGAGAEVFFVHPLRPLHCLHGESKRHLLAGTGAGFFTMKSMKDMKAPLLSPCRPLRVLRGLHGEWNRLCVLAALREVFVGWVEGFSGEKAGSSLLDGVSGGSDLVLDGAFKVLGGAFKVLDGASKVLGGAFKVLEEPEGVTGGAGKRPSTNAECLHPAEKIAAFCEVNALRRSGLVSPALGVWRCGSAPCSCRAGCFTACEKVRATRQRRAFDRRALR